MTIFISIKYIFLTYKLFIYYSYKISTNKHYFILEKVSTNFRLNSKKIVEIHDFHLRSSPGQNFEFQLPLDLEPNALQGQSTYHNIYKHALFHLR